MTIPWKEWENPNGEWKHHCPGMSPYKDHFAPLRLVPGCDKPHHILLDFCHIFHLGYGLDMGSSSIILLCILAIGATPENLMMHWKSPMKSSTFGAKKTIVHLRSTISPSSLLVWVGA